MNQDSRLNGKKIFIFEDDDKLALNVFRYLSIKDFEVKYSVEAPAGLKMLKEFTPDLVITDINMPELDGYCVFKEVQKLFPGLPVVIMTGEHKLQKLFEIEGVAAFIKKPFDMATLEDTVAEALLNT